MLHKNNIAIHFKLYRWYFHSHVALLQLETKTDLNSLEKRSGNVKFFDRLETNYGWLERVTRRSQLKAFRRASVVGVMLAPRFGSIQ